MKKIIGLFLAILLTYTLVACSKAPSQSEFSPSNFHAAIGLSKQECLTQFGLTEEDLEPDIQAPDTAPSNFQRYRVNNKTYSVFGGTFILALHFMDDSLSSVYLVDNTQLQAEQALQQLSVVYDSLVSQYGEPTTYPMMSNLVSQLLDSAQAPLSNQNYIEHFAVSPIDETQQIQRLAQLDFFVPENAEALISITIADRSTATRR